MHALLDPFLCRDRDAEQLDLVAHLVGIADIGQRDRLDAFDVDRRRD